MRVLSFLDHGTVKIVNLDILASDGVSNCPPVFALVLSDVLMCICLGVDLGVAMLLVMVQILHELLDVRYAVLTRIVLRRRGDMLLGVHFEAALVGERAQLGRVSISSSS